MSDFSFDGTMGSRPALKEITENDRPQTRSSPASKKPLTTDRPKDTSQQIEDIVIEGTENQIKEEVGYISNLTSNRVPEKDKIQVKNQQDKHKDSSGVKPVSPLTILPDIINVQPIIVEEDNKESQISTPAKDTYCLQIESKGNSTLTVPSIACDAVSSDEELFAECQSYMDQQMPLDDEFNRSVHWNSVLSNVTSSNLENLENIEHTSEQGVADITLGLELHEDHLPSEHKELPTEHKELPIEHKVHDEQKQEAQSPAGPSAQNQKSSLDTKNECQYSPDSTLKLINQEHIKYSVDLDMTVDLATICKEVNSLCYVNESLDGNISSTISPPAKNCSDSGIEMKDTETFNKTDGLNSTFDSQNSSHNITSTLETVSEVKCPEQTFCVPITANISEIEKISDKYKLNQNLQMPEMALELKQSPEKEVCSPKINLESTFSANQMSLTFSEAPERDCDLNQTIELPAASREIIQEHNSSVDQLIKNVTPELNESAQKSSPNIKADNNLSVTTIMDQTMVVGATNVPEPMDVDYVESPLRNEGVIKLQNQMDPPPTAAARKRRSVEPPSEKDFQGHGFILNPSDFDFLLSKGSNTSPVDDRNSVLLRFDPLLGRPVPVNQSQVYNPNLIVTAEKEEEVNNSRDCSQSSGKAVIHEEINASNIVRPEKSQANVPTTIKKDSESPQISKPLIKQENNTSKELIQSNVKMSVDVIQGLDIENDTKSEDNLRQKTENNQEYKMDDMEKKIKNEVLKTEDIEKKLKDAEQREEALLKRITEKDKTIAKMSGVIEAYEKAIAELIAEKEQIIQNYEKQMLEIKSERDVHYKHLTSLESTFTDLHAKYERSKQITSKLKASEEDLKQEKKKNLENLILQEERYEKMKSHAMQQLEIANNKLDTLQRNHAMEVTRLKALLKKEELARLSVAEQLQQKTRENVELMKICDELINGQGASS